jgi:hypothetical protein
VAKQFMRFTGGRNGHLLLFDVLECALSFVLFLVLLGHIERRIEGRRGEGL